jgi:hypothetical protein
LVALGIQHAMRMRRIVIYGLSTSKIFFHIIPQKERFSKKGTKYRIFVSIFCTSLSETFFILRRIERDIIKKCTLVLTQNTRNSCQILMKLEFSRQFYENYSNIILNENPTSGSRFVPRGRTDMTKLIVAFRNLANAPKNQPVNAV